MNILWLPCGSLPLVHITNTCQLFSVPCHSLLSPATSTSIPSSHATSSYATWHFRSGFIRFQIVHLWMTLVILSCCHITMMTSAWNILCSFSCTIIPCCRPTWCHVAPHFSIFTCFDEILEWNNFHIHTVFCMKRMSLEISQRDILIHTLIFNI